MVYQIKALFKNKITFLLLVLSFTLSFTAIYKIYQRVNLPNEGVYLSYQDYYVQAYKNLAYEEKFLDLTDPYQENYLKYLKWTVDRRYKLGNFYLDSYRDYKADIDAYMNLYLMAEMNICMDRGVGAESLRERYGYSYLDLANKDLYDFDLDLLEEYGMNYLNYAENKSYAYPVYKSFVMGLDHRFDLKEKGYREVDFFTESPWTYLAEIYSKNSIKGKVFFPCLIIFSTYIVNLARQERTFNLLASKKGKRSFAFRNYVLLSFIMLLIVVFFSDLISILFMGIKNGFAGLKNPMYIYRDGLKSFSTYENIGASALSLGLSDLYPLPINSQEYYYLSDLYQLELWKFLGLSLLMDILKLGFFAVLGASIGLIIKSPLLSIALSSFLAMVGIISGQVRGAWNSFNVFSINTGWNHVLGWPRFSWAWAILLLLISSCLVYFVAASVFKKRDLV